VNTQLKIKAVNHGTKKTDKNRYCGPSVISAVTALTTGEAARLLRHVTGKASIKGTHSSHLIAALAKCNIDVYWDALKGPKGRKTLGQWLKSSAASRGSDVFLVSAGHHWQLVQGRRFVCGITGEVVSQKHPKVKRKAIVKGVWILKAKGSIIKPDAACAPDRAGINEAYVDFRNYCKDRGLTYTIAHDGYIEFSDGIAFPHYRCWQETQQRHSEESGWRIEGAEVLYVPANEDDL
jgi:hypothetical protein